MIYDDIYNKLNNGQDALVSTCLKTGKLTLLESAAAGLHETQFIEHFAPYPQLVLLGAGHISAAVCTVCADLGFKITVVDDRKQFADKINFPKADKVIVSTFDEFLSAHNGGEGTYYAILTRGHFQDRLCLEHILKKKCTYIGMIGSRRKNQMVFTQLLKSGFSQDDIKRVNAPIGLDISAQTPEEIAISIAAQLISVRSKQHGGTVFDAKVLQSLCSQSVAVLATIYEKSGSAPRGTGAKMALLKNGCTVGTVGGGSSEAAIINIMKNFTTKVYELAEIEMSNESAEKEGLICGGKIKVLVSKI